MASYNRIILMGNITRDPELRYTQGSDLPIARTGIAVNHFSKGKEEPMFIDIVVFGKQAENLQAYVTKGSPLLVEGRLSQSNWEQEGVRRTKHEIIVDNFRFIGTKKDRVDDPGVHNTGGSFSSHTDMGDDDDIPF